MSHNGSFTRLLINYYKIYVSFLSIVYLVIFTMSTPIKMSTPDILAGTCEFELPTEDLDFDKLRNEITKLFKDLIKISDFKKLSELVELTQKNAEEYFKEMRSEEFAAGRVTVDYHFSAPRNESIDKYRYEVQKLLDRSLEQYLFQDCEHPEVLYLYKPSDGSFSRCIKSYIQNRCLPETFRLSFLNSLKNELSPEIQSPRNKLFKTANPMAVKPYFHYKSPSRVYVHKDNVSDWQFGFGTNL